MLEYEDIVDAPVAKLKTAADDWADMVTKLDGLADDANDRHPGRRRTRGRDPRGRQGQGHGEAPRGGHSSAAAPQ
ncbi:hypothetical protein [Kitasatospora cinereorecta]